MTRRSEHGNAVGRRQFLEVAVASAGIAAIGCNRDTPPPAAPAATPAQPQAPPQSQSRPVTSLREVPFTKGALGTGKGAFVTFEGLCAIVLPAQSGDPVRVGLLAGHHHVATLKLHRDSVSDGATWLPSASDDDHYYYALQGLHIRITTPRKTPVESNYKKVTTDCPSAADWQNLGWALDVRSDLQANNALKPSWWKDAGLVDSVFELDRGFLEGGFDGNETEQIELNAYKWKLPSGTKRVLKQAIAYRVDMEGVTFEAGSLGSSSADKRFTLRRDGLAYAAVKHFPLGPKKPRLPTNTPLDEAKAYYSLLDQFTGTMAVPHAADKSEDCMQPPRKGDEGRTPDCTCCPPGVYV